MSDVLRCPCCGRPFHLVRGDQGGFHPIESDPSVRPDEANLVVVAGFVVGARHVCTLSGERP